MVSNDDNSTLLQLGGMANGSATENLTDTAASGETGSYQDLTASQTFLISTAYSLQAFIIILTNVPVVVAVCIFSALHKKVHNILILNLSCSNIIKGVLLLPVSVVCIQHNDWFRYSAFAKQLFKVTGGFCNFGTLMALVALSLEKYIYIQYPFQHTRLFTKSRILIGVLVIWLVTALFSLSLTATSNDLFAPSTFNPVNVLVLSMLFVFPLVVLVYTNLKIAAVVRQQVKRIHASSRPTYDSSRPSFLSRYEIKAIKEGVHLVLLYFLLYSPSTFLILIEALYGHMPDIFYKHLLCQLVLYIYSIVTPVVHASNVIFRRAYRKFLTCDRTAIAPQP
ncbi:trace amine-associated receptor 7d-like [Ptychodera flava]|uniref:trace amine-associated receptor 7d-like n=1 Tax=Ptychodera flava TaxID=63121 RepID=UPI003969C69C